MNRTIADFHANELLRGIPREVLDEIGIDLPIEHFAAQETIFEEGSDGEVCYLVDQGLVRISKEGGAADAGALGCIGPNEFFGELALYYATPRSARATAVVPTVVARLDRPTFNRLRTAVPFEVMSAIAGAGIRHLREMHTHLLQARGDSSRFHAIGLELGIIAHDLRSPLATIQNAADLVLDLVRSEGGADPAVAKFVEIIARTARGALAGTDELLAQVRGEAGEEFASVDPAELADEVRELASGLGSVAGVVVEVHAERTEPFVAMRGRLVRAIINLVRNAVEALPPEGGRVEVQIAPDGADAVISIRDTGRGMQPSVLARIFERRFTHGKARGTGLGLSQVRETIDLHGGRINVESVPGEGTVFQIRLPPRVE